MATVICDRRGMLASQLPAREQQRLVETYKERGKSYQQLYDALVTARHGRTCAAPGCGRHEHEVGKCLHRCAVCGVVRYCSRECQKLHWKAERRPHRAVCSVIARLSTLLDGAIDDFAAAYRGINEDDLALVFDQVESQYEDDGRSTPERLTCA